MASGLQEAVVEDSKKMKIVDNMYCGCLLWSGIMRLIRWLTLY